MGLLQWNGVRAAWHSAPIAKSMRYVDQEAIFVLAAVSHLPKIELLFLVLT